MSITPSSPGKAKGERFEHGSVLGRKTRGARVSSQWKSTHSVRTASKVLDMIEELLPRNRGRVVMHWFSGTEAEAKRAAELGCYFSINQVMFEKPMGQKLVRSLPTKRLLTETDGPFVEEDKQPIGPGKVQKVVHDLSDTFGISLGQARKLIVQNLVDLVS
jgi:TatD DNase family protein